MLYISATKRIREEQCVRTFKVPASAKQGTYGGNEIRPLGLIPMSLTVFPKNVNGKFSGIYSTGKSSTSLTDDSFPVRRTVDSKRSCSDIISSAIKVTYVKGVLRSVIAGYTLPKGVDICPEGSSSD